MASDIKVVKGTNIKRSATFINPKVNAADSYDVSTNTTVEANNVLAEGETSLSAIRKFYGRN